MFACHVRSRLITLAFLAALPVTTGGCSWFIVHGPPAQHAQMTEFSCTQSMAGPYVDAGLGLFFTINGIINGSRQTVANSMAAVIDYLIAAGFEFATLTGVKKVNNCRAASAQLADRLAGRSGGAAKPAALQPKPSPPAAVTPAAQPPPPAVLPVTAQPAAAQPVAQPPAAAPPSAQPAPAAIAPPSPPPPPVVRFVVVSPAQDTVQVGRTVQLAATARDNGGAAVAGRTFTWSSSNEGVAAVSNAGVVTGRAAGLVVIAARADSVVGRARVLVVP